MKDAWPRASTLSKRFKALVSRLLKVNMQKVLGDGHTPSGQKDGHAAAAVGVWSKRDQAAFLRTVMTYVVPDWPASNCSGSLPSPLVAQLQTFRKRWSGLAKKTDQELVAFGQELISRCEALVAKTAKSELEQTGVVTLVLSETKARKVLDRIQLLRSIAFVLSCTPEEELTKRGSRIKQRSSLPGWWEVGRDDIQLLVGVIKHGFGRWEALKADPSMLWCSGMPQAEGSDGGLVQFPREKALEDRCRFLVDFLLSQPPAPSSEVRSLPPVAKKRGKISYQRKLTGGVLVDTPKHRRENNTTKMENVQPANKQGRAAREVEREAAAVRKDHSKEKHRPAASITSQPADLDTQTKSRLPKRKLGSSNKDSSRSTARCETVVSTFFSPATKPPPAKRALALRDAPKRVREASSPSSTMRKTRSIRPK